jgi:hypothetical protein
MHAGSPVAMPDRGTPTLAERVAEIRSGLQIDASAPVEAGFVWSDLVAEPTGRIHASHLRLLPDRARVPVGLDVDPEASAAT